MKTQKTSDEKFSHTLNLSIPILLFLCFISFFLGCNEAAKSNPDESIITEMVKKYMTAIKDKDIASLISMSGMQLEDEMKKNINEGIRKLLEDQIVIDLKNYEIKNIKIDGGVAFVTVEENRKVAPKIGETPKGMETDYKTVTEEIVLIKRDGKWKFDAVNTLRLSKIDFKDGQKTLKDLNNLGVARVMTLVMDPDISTPLLAFIMPNLIHARGQGQFTTCMSNCKNIATALEMYSTDNAGHYPKSLSQLTPTYLKQIPTCPSAGKDTYSKSYQRSEEPKRYTFYCEGEYHKAVGAPPNHPQYDPIEGLIPK